MTRTDALAKPGPPADDGRGGGRRQPQARSRTLDAALHVARELAGREPGQVVDLAELGTRLLDWATPRYCDWSPRSATPTSSWSPARRTRRPTPGLLKLFLDRFPGGTGLTGAAVPLMLGGGPTHALAPELCLRPLLTELGAVVPVAGLYVVDSRYDQPESYADWLATARPVLHHFLAHPLLEGVS